MDEDRPLDSRRRGDSGRSHYMGEVKVEVEKLCPLFVSTAASAEWLVPAVCLKEGCAWWNEQLKQCAVLSFSLLMMGQLVEA